METGKVLEFLKELTPGKNIVCVYRYLTKDGPKTSYGVAQVLENNNEAFYLSKTPRETVYVRFKDIIEISEIPIYTIAEFLNAQRSSLDDLAKDSSNLK